MTTLAQLKTKILGVLGDDILTEDDEGTAYEYVRGSTYDEVILLASVEAALRRISSRVWKPSTFELSEELTEFDLPADLLDIEGVYENGLEKFLPRLQFVIGSTNQLSEGNAWFIYPYGKITFINAVGSDGAIVYYSAGWALPTGETSVIDSPDYAETALILYAASYCLLQATSASAEVSQFKTRVDSGSPTDIPAKDVSSYFLQRFENELSSLPVTEKAVR